MSNTRATTLIKLGLIAFVGVSLFFIYSNFQPEPQDQLDHTTKNVSHNKTDQVFVESPNDIVPPIQTKIALTNQTFQGSVIYLDNQPASGIKVVARRIRTDNNPSALYPLSKPIIATTSPNGVFIFEDLKAGRYQVNIADNQGYKAVASLIHPEQDLLFELSPIPLIHISGQVIDTNLQGIADVEVSVANHSKPSVYSDEHGYYSLTIEHALSYYLSFNAQGYYSKHDVVSATVEDFDTLDVPPISLVPITPLHTLTGRLIDDFGNPIANENIHLFSASLNIRKKATSNTQGEFYLTELPTTSDYQLHVRTRGAYASHQQSHLTVDESTPNLVIHLQPVAMAELSGRLVDTHGNPVSNLSLKLTSATLRGANITVTVDEHGYFSARNLPSGSITLTSYTKPLTQISGISLDPLETLNIQIPLDVGDSYIDGEVTDFMGSPVANAQITVEGTTINDFKVRSLRTATSTSGGTFNFEKLGNGEHLIKIKAKGFNTKQMLISPQQSWVSIQLLSNE